MNVYFSQSLETPLNLGVQITGIVVQLCPYYPCGFGLIIFLSLGFSSIKWVKSSHSVYFTELL